MFHNKLKLIKWLQYESFKGHKPSTSGLMSKITFAEKG